MSERDIRETVEHLIRRALDLRTPENDRVSSAFRAIEIIDKYRLLWPAKPASGGDQGSQAIRKVVDFVDRATRSEVVRGVADRVDGIVSGVERIRSSLGKVKGAADREPERPRWRRRQ